MNVFDHIITRVIRFSVAVILLVYILRCVRGLIIEPTSGSTRDFNISSTFPFIPTEPRSLSDCRRLFLGTPIASFNLSADYWASLKVFEAAVVDSLVGQVAEGFSQQLPSMYKAMHFLAAQPTVKHACETGFNLGHSAFNFLTANRQSVVHSFDLGKHGYARVMAEFMSKRFPGRFFIHFGDSSETLPEFIRSNPNYRCDLLFVDGEHTFNGARADLMNFAAIANVENGAVVVLDDYPSLPFDCNVGVAWEDIRRWGYVHEVMRCFYPPKRERGFTIGRVVSRPSVAWKRIN
jgi:Methyltransferase domain